MKAILTFIFLITVLIGHTQVWSPVGGGANSFVDALELYKGEVMVGGDFVQAGGINISGVASWDGNAWDSLRSGIDAWRIGDMIEFQNDLYVTGGFFMVDGMWMPKIARWDGATWDSLGSGITGFSPKPLALAVYKNELYVAGIELDYAGGVPFYDFILRWDGSKWDSVGGGIYGVVRALKIYKGELYAAGDFLIADGKPASMIAKWDGSSWSTVGGGVSGSRIAALEVFQDKLIAGGSFYSAGSISVGNIAQWNGVKWDSLYAGIEGQVWTLEAHNHNLYVGGSFNKAGVKPANNIAKWNGSNWFTLGQGTAGFAGGQVISLLSDTIKNCLYVGGYFKTAGGITCNNIAKWTEPTGIKI